MDKTGTKKYAVPLIMIIGGIIFAAFMYMRTTQLVARCTQQVPGVVSNVRSQRDSDSHTTSYKVTVDYQVNGADYSNKFKVKKNVSRGTEVTVNYNPSDPTEIFIDGLHKSAGSHIRTGGFVAILGVIWLVVTNKNSKRESDSPDQSVSDA